jgi:hypothetical protein
MTGDRPGKPAALASPAGRCGHALRTPQVPPGVPQLNTMLEGR